MISRIEALYYRSLGYVTQDLRPFQVLVGPNASGKSTFLDVVALLGDFVRYGLDKALLFGTEAGRGRASQFEELVSRRPEPVPVEDRHRQLGMFPVEPEPPHTLMTTNKTPPGWQTIVRKVAEAGNDYYKAEGGKWNIMYRIGPRRAALAGLPEDEARFPITLWVRNLLLDGVRVLALNSAAMRRPVSPSLSRSFSVEGANLPLVVQDLERNHPLAYADWIAHLRTILPDLGSVSVHERPEDRHLFLAVRYTSAAEAVPSWLVSDGTLRLLALTLLAYLPEQTGIYLIEEPENGIHPRALEGVYQSLSSVYNGQILVATHSPLFLGLAQPSQLLCFAKNPSGAVDIVAGDRHPALQSWRGEVDLPTLYAAGCWGEQGSDRPHGRRAAGEDPRDAAARAP